MQVNRAVDRPCATAGSVDDRRAIEMDPGREEVQDFWRVPDVDFQNQLTAQVTKVINVSLIAHMVYDKFDANTNVDLSRETGDLEAVVDASVRKSVQWRQVLALGLTWSVF